MPRTSITPTPHQLRALTHPARMRMLGMLRIDGPATATSLAQRLGLNTGATSYHLRQLAEHGFIEDDPERGTGRERWWRASHTFTHYETPPNDDVAARDAGDAFFQSIATVYAETMQRAVEEGPLLPDAWRQASTLSDFQPRLTPHGARRLRDRLLAVLAEAEDEDHPDAVPFSVHVMAFPRPGSVAAAGDESGEDAS